MRVTGRLQYLVCLADGRSMALDSLAWDSGAQRLHTSSRRCRVKTCSHQEPHVPRIHRHTYTRKDENKTLIRRVFHNRKTIIVGYKNVRLSRVHAYVGTWNVEVSSENGECNNEKGRIVMQEKNQEGTLGCPDAWIMTNTPGGRTRYD